MSDDDDRRLFAPLENPGSVDTILLVKRNDRNATDLELQIGDLGDRALLDDRARLRLGQILGQATCLETLYLAGYHQNLGSLLGGLAFNRSIKSLNIPCADLGGTRLSQLDPFLKHNHSLVDLSLIDCNIDSTSLDLLSRALLERSEDTLESLNLDNNSWGADANLEKLAEVLKRNRSMDSLSLDNTGIGKKGCNSLAGLLSDPNSKLISLYLDHNSIDNVALTTLVDSLANNTKLRTLGLDSNSAISKVGWSKILKLVCNSSSIEGVVLDSNEVINRVLSSNHTLCNVGICSSDREAVARALGVEDANFLFSSLGANGSYDDTGEYQSVSFKQRHKIIWSHARGDLNIGDSSIVDDVRVLPDILAWFSVDQNGAVPNRDLPFPDEKVGAIRLGSLFGIVRSRPVELCSKDHPVKTTNDLQARRVNELAKEN